MVDYCELTGLGVAEAVKLGRVSVVEYTNALMARIAEKEADIQAWQWLVPEFVHSQAAALDSRGDLSELPLPGIAVGVKDIIDTKDLPTENGTVLDTGRRPAADAAVVQRLREAGAVVMGKTVTTELAFMQPSKTRNPHRLAHTPGGSSSGSAAAVAAGMVPLALGTQTNGSVIRPASFCGVYGLKPTYDLFPRTGVLEEAGTLDTIGAFARSLDDLAAVADICAVSSPSRPSPHDFLRAAREPLAAARIAFIKTPSWPLAEEGTRQAFITLADALGASCTALDLPPAFEQAVAYHRTIMLAEIALNFGRYYEQDRERLSAAMRGAIEQGRAIAAVAYAEAIRARNALYEEFARLLEPFDAAITPAAPGPAPHGLDTTGNPVFCTLWTYLGVPALNLPLLSLNGLPLGVQMIGLRHGEETLFKAAGWLQSHRAGQQTIRPNA